MKFQLVHLSTASEDWSKLVVELYQKKINHFVPIEIVHLKSKKAAREHSSHKLEIESDLILNYIKADDFVVVFDERGKKLNSIDFSKSLERILSSGKKRALFIIGGAYGISPEVRKNAQLCISFSDMVFSHLIAQAVALEQIYRAFTILRNIPYHNE